MTELEQLYFNGKKDFEHKIENSLKLKADEDKLFIENVNKEFDYSFDFEIGVTAYGYTTGEFVVDTLDEALKYKEGELEVRSGDICWNTLDVEDEVAEVDWVSPRVFGLSLINPSPEAQELLQKSA